MATTTLKLEDLTKDELITLIHRASPMYSIDRFIKEVRYDTLIREARKLADEAIREQNKWMNEEGPTGRTMFLKASQKFTEAMELYNKADAFMKGGE